MNQEIVLNDLRDQVAAMQRRLDRLEGSSFLMHTTQVQPISAVSDSADAATVRAGLQQVIRALRTFGLGG